MAEREQSNNISLKGKISFEPTVKTGCKNGRDWKVVNFRISTIRESQKNATGSWEYVYDDFELSVWNKDIEGEIVRGRRVELENGQVYLHTYKSKEGIDKARLAIKTETDNFRLCVFNEDNQRVALVGSWGKDQIRPAEQMIEEPIEEPAGPESFDMDGNDIPF